MGPSDEEPHWASFVLHRPDMSIFCRVEINYKGVTVKDPYYIKKGTLYYASFSTPAQFLRELEDILTCMLPDYDY